MSARRRAAAKGSPQAAESLDTIGFFLFTLALVLGICLPEDPSRPYGAVLLTAILSAALLALVAAAFLRRQWPYRFRSTDPAVVALVALAAVSIVWATHKHAAVVRSVELVGLAVAFFLSRWFSANAVRRRTVLSVLIATTIVVVVVGLYQYFHGFQEMMQQVHDQGEAVTSELGLSPGALPDLVSRIDTKEVFSVFLLSNVFAGYLLAFMPVFIALVVVAWRTPSRTEAALWLIALAAVVSVFVLTKSKGAFLAGGGLAVLVAGAWLLSKRFRPRTLALVGFAVAAFAAFGMTAFLWDKEEQLIARGGSLSVRLGFVKGAVGIITHHPVTGTGAGNFNQYYFTYKPPWAHEVQEAHSSILQAASELGVVGGLLLVLLAIMLCYEVTRPDAWRAPPDLSHDRPRDALAGAGLGGVVALLLLPLVFQAQTAVAALLLVMLWIVAFAAATRTLMTISQDAQQKILYAGVALGVAAMALHSLIDIHLEVRGTAIALAALAGWLTAGPASAVRADRRNFTGARRWVALAAALGWLCFLQLAVARPIGRTQAALANAREAFRKGHVQEAIGFADEAGQANPLSPEPDVMLADFLTARGRLHEASKIMSGLTEDVPRESAYWRRLGRICGTDFKLAKRDQYDYDPIQAYEHALAVYPSDTRSLLALAQLYEECARQSATGKTAFLEKAREYYHRFLDIARVNTDRHMRLDDAGMNRIRQRVKELDDVITNASRTETPGRAEPTEHSGQEPVRE